MGSFDEIVNPSGLISKYLKEKDRKKAFNLVNLDAAARLIWHFFGPEWYRVVFANPSIEKSPEDKRSLVNFLGSDKINHPLTEDFWSGIPTRMLRVFQLGYLLKVLAFSNNVKNIGGKIKDLKKMHFDRYFYELRIAGIFAENDFLIEFIKDKKRSPDMRVTKDNISTLIECKKREPVSESSINKKTLGVRDRFLDASAQLKNVGIVCVEVEDGLDYSSEEVKRYSIMLSKEVKQHTNVACVILTWQKFQDNDVIYGQTLARSIVNESCNARFPVKEWCDPKKLSPRRPKVIVTLDPVPPLSSELINQK